MRKIHNPDSSDRGDYDFGCSVPAFRYSLDAGELLRTKEFKKAFDMFSYDEQSNQILLWLLTGIDKTEFAYLCAYFMERELGYEMGIGSLALAEITIFRGYYPMPGGRKKYMTLVVNHALCSKWEESWGILERETQFGHPSKEDILFVGLYSDKTVPIQDAKDWNREKVLEIYEKYFFDPNAGWEAFSHSFKRKKFKAEELKASQHEANQSDISAETSKDLTDHSIDIELLKNVRMGLAEKEGVPEKNIFSDRILKEMAKKGPRRKAQFLLIRGITPKKYEKYGEPFLLAILNSYQRTSKGR